MPEGYRCIIAQTEEIKRIISSLRGKKFTIDSASNAHIFGVKQL